MTLLKIIAANRELALGQMANPLFDGGLARFNVSGQLVDAFPSLEAWRVRPVAEWLAMRNPGPEAEANKAIFSPLFVNPLSNRNSLLIALVSGDNKLVAGVVSLERLGLTEIVGQAKTTSVPGLAEPRTGSILAIEVTWRQATLLPFWWTLPAGLSIILTRR